MGSSGIMPGQINRVQAGDMVLRLRLG
jgi:hypothetical protein